MVKVRKSMPASIEYLPNVDLVSPFFLAWHLFAFPLRLCGEDQIYVPARKREN
jgi:hypothetical protein